MKNILIVSILVFSKLIFAEQNLNNMDQQFLQMMQKRAQENEKEEEFKNPKKPKLDTSRAVFGDRKAKIQIIDGIKNCFVKLKQELEEK